MTKKLTNFRIDEELLAGLQQVRERDGVAVSEQVRRAIVAWLQSKHVTVKKKAERPRAVTRKRS